MINMNNTLKIKISKTSIMRKINKNQKYMYKIVIINKVAKKKPGSISKITKKVFKKRIISREKKIKKESVEQIDIEMCLKKSSKN